MNRRKYIILTGILIFALSILVSGCANQVEGSDHISSDEKVIIKDTIEEDYKDMYNVSLTVKDQDTLIYEISTLKDFIIQTGRSYTVEKLNDIGQWDMIDLELMFTMEMIIVKSDSPFSQEIDISKFEDGEYRVSKHLMDGEGKLIDGLGTIEFEILD